MVPSRETSMHLGFCGVRVIHSMFLAGMHSVLAVARHQNSMFIGCWVERTLEWFLGCPVDIASLMTKYECGSHANYLHSMYFVSRKCNRECSFQCNSQRIQ